MRNFRKSIWIATALLMPFGATAQERGTAPMAFEVASVKPNTPDGSGVFRAGLQPQPGGRLNATGANLRMLIRFAYNVDDTQISGGPSWIDSDRYDIVAKGDSNATTDQIRQMLQTLLAERFGLKLHRETKDLPVFELVQSKGGAKLKEIKDDASSAAPEGDMRRAGGGSGVRRGVAIMMGGTTQIGGVMSMSQLSQTLATLVGRKVIDKTDLPGNYGVKIEWTPQPGEMMMMRGMPPGGFGDKGAPPTPDPNGISIFTAIQEQLGLRLESSRGPVDVLVIDSAVKPAQN